MGRGNNSGNKWRQNDGKGERREALTASIACAISSIPNGHPRVPHEP